MSIAEKLVTIAENEQKVYEAGQQTEYDRFWDNYQDNGNRTNYENAFAGYGWTTETFKPKYDIKPTSAYMLFRYDNLNGIDLVKYLENLGITLDFSNSTNVQYAFYGTNIERIGVLDFRNAEGTLATRALDSPRIITIDLLKVGEKNTDLNWFGTARNLKNLTIEGVIVADLNVKACTLLSHKSLMSIINALKDFRLVNSTYSNVTYQWDGTEGNGEIGKVYETNYIAPNSENIEFQFSWGTDYETDYHVIVLKVRNLNITEEELSKVKTFMIDSNGNLVLGIQQETPTTTKTLTLHADSKAKLTAAQIQSAEDKGWNVV